MNFADNIDYPPLLRRPPMLAALVFALFVAFMIAQPAQIGLGKSLTGSLGLTGFAANALLASFAAVLIGADIYLVLGLPLRSQVVVVWVQLVLILALFFVSFDLSYTFIRRKLWLLLSQGLLTTLAISAASIFFASVLALAGAVAKLSASGLALGVANFYTSFFRGVPLLMQIYIIYLGLPQLGIVVDAIPSGIIALSLCYGAYMTEIFRAGIESVPRGQWEAARALGLRPGQTLARVILPQALPVIIPPTGNQFIAMLKDSSLVSVIGVWELMYLARTEGQTEFRHIEMMVTASMIYWAFSGALELIQAHIERLFGKPHAR